MAMQALEEGRLKLEDAWNAVGPLEGLVENVLAGDLRMARADEALEDSVEEYKQAQGPGLLDVLGFVTNIASAIKSSAGLIGSLLKSAADRKRGEVAGAVVDIVGAATSSADGAVSAMAGRDAAMGGDEVVGMVKALDLKIAVVAKQVGSLQDYAVGAEARQIASDLELALQKHRAAVQDVAHIDGAHSKRLDEALETASKELAAKGSGIDQRLAAMGELLRARGNDGRESELAKGTHGRSVFDLVKEDRNRCVLVEEKRLHVSVDGRGHERQSLKPESYWLRCADSKLQRAVKAELFFELSLAPRPVFALPTDIRVPPRMLGPLKSVVNVDTEPHTQVEVSGDYGHALVDRAEWEDGERRKELVDRLMGRPVERTWP